MTLPELIDAVEAPARTVTVLNRSQPDPVYEMLVEFFDPMDVEVREASLSTAEPADAVVLHEGEQPVAVSTLAELYDGVLGVNVDRYATDVAGFVELELPDVVAALGDVRIPGDAANKFTFVQVSRYVEALAHEVGGGQVHAGFQRLSRLSGERGTREVYRRLAEAGVDAHVYGVPDRPPADLPVTVHGHDVDELRACWFVAYDGAGNDAWTAALVAEEVAEDTYRGFWTFDPERVAEVLSYVRGTYPATD